MLDQILKKGFFPKELPTPFNTESYSNQLIASKSSLPSPFTYNLCGPRYISRPLPYNLARRGQLRRALSIPNPINFFHIADLISTNWSDLESHLGKANRSISKPALSSMGRAFEWEKGFNSLSKSKLKIRNANKFVVETDISNFYPSIYTHSISWALYTKSIAKKSRGFEDNLGNKIDKIIQNAQDAQTKGILISPDTSFVVSEIILTSIDEILVNKFKKMNYFRYIDDFEFGCGSAQEADDIVGVIQEALSEYELTLNSSKTKIKRLPCPINPLWVHELAAFKFRTTKKGQEKDLLHYFDLSINRFNENENDAVIKYAIKRTASLGVDRNNWPLYENLLLQWAIAEPGVLPTSLNFLKYYATQGFSLNKQKIKQTLEYITKTHAPLGHTSELSWSIWGMILFKLSFDKEIIDIVTKIENSIIALLCLDAKQQGLIDKTYTFPLWAKLMNKDELIGANWLLAYEAYIKGWLPSANGRDYVKVSEGFSFLKKKNVQFYNPSATAKYTPRIKYCTIGGYGT